MTTALERTLSQVRAKIHRARMSQLLSDRLSLVDIDGVNSQLFAPILSALGWSVEDAEEVRLDFQVDGVDDGYEVALFLSGAPCLLVELRGMREEFDQKRVIGQLLPRASDAGFEWVLLTDGDDYDIFNAHAGLSIEQRPFDAIRLSDDSMAEAVEFFDLFSRMRMEENRLESVWNRRTIDRKVQQSFEELLASEETLVEMLLSKTKDLSASDIRSALARATIVLQFGSRCRSECVCADEFEQEAGRAAEMSETELRVATWLQHRSIERWAKGGVGIARSRTSQRRGQGHRRARDDRRSNSQDRRNVRVERSTERRGKGERRSQERRRDLERRVTDDRRRVRRRA